MQDITFYRRIELDTEHYLLCAKVDFPPRWLSTNKKSSFKPRRSLQNKNFYESIRWLYIQTAKFHLNNIKENKTDIEKELENLQNILKSAAFKSLGKIKRRNRRKCLKIWVDQIKELIKAKKKSCKNG
jgi:hypothetical protein